MKAMSLFDGMPLGTTPSWKFWLARILGKTIYKKGNFIFKKWRDCLWIFEVRKC